MGEGALHNAAERRHVCQRVNHTTRRHQTHLCLGSFGSSLLGGFTNRMHHANFLILCWHSMIELHWPQRIALGTGPCRMR